MREKWIDFIKGVAIYSVVLGHSIQYIYCHGEKMEDNFVFYFIYSFHMALFAMISGYLHYYSVNKYETVNVFLRKVETILIPCLIWGSIHFIYELGRGWAKPTIQSYVSIILTHNWFLWAIFYCSLVVGIFKLLFRKYLYLVGALFIFSAMFWPDYLNLIGFKMMFPAYLIGFYVNDREILLKYRSSKLKRQLLIWIAVALIYIVLLFFVVDKNAVMHWSFYLSDNKVLNLELLLKRLIIGIIGSVMMVLLLLHIFDRLTKAYSINFICLLGKDSLGIYMVQSLIYGYGLGILYRFSELSAFSRAISTVGLNFVIIGVSFGIVNIIKKNKYTSQFFLGLKKNN